MTQAQYFSFGVDKVSFIDSQYNVYSIDDPQNASLNLTFETTQHRGGANNDVRASAVHSRNGEITIGTGYIDLKLAQLLTGGTITSLGTSAASIVTGTASGITSLYGGTNTLATGITSIVINSPTLVKTTDYYITANSANQVQVTRVEDGKQFGALTTVASTAGLVLDSERGIVFNTGTSGASLTIGEKARVSARVAINSINQKIVFDNTKPTDLSILITADFNGTRRQINIPVAQPAGTMQGNGAAEFQVQDLKMTVENSSALNELADILLQG